MLAVDANWGLLCCLPQQVLLEVVTNDNLVVRTENTVGVAVVSWLRSAGKDAPKAERKAVMAQVRLLQLSPWFVAWFTFHVSEARQLLPPGSLAELVRYIAHPAQCHKQQLASNNTFLQDWGTSQRLGSSPNSVAEP